MPALRLANDKGNRREAAPLESYMNSTKPGRGEASELTALLGVLNTEIRHIFDNEISFLERFGKGQIMDLTEVSFTSHDLKIVYVLDCGQHVCDTVAMDDYFEWRDA